VKIRRGQKKLLKTRRTGPLFTGHREEGGKPGTRPMDPASPGPVAEPKNRALSKGYQVLAGIWLIVFFRTGRTKRKKRKRDG